MRRRWILLGVLGVAAGLALVAATTRDRCVGPPYDMASDPSLAGLLDRALPVLQGYPSLFEALQRTAPNICLSDAPSEAFGYYEPDTNRVVIAAELDPALQVAILFHELRHVEQFGRGICPNDALAMGEYARAIWALEADATTISLILAWDMRQSGDPGPWDALVALPRYADMARGFADAMAGGDDIFAASEAAFTLWYANEDRRHDYYIASCGAYLDRQDASHALPRYDDLHDDFFDSLCVLPDGTPFACQEPALP